MDTIHTVGYICNLASVRTLFLVLHHHLSIFLKLRIYKAQYVLPLHTVVFIVISISLKLPKLGFSNIIYHLPFSCSYFYLHFNSIAYHFSKQSVIMCQLTLYQPCIKTKKSNQVPQDQNLIRCPAWTELLSDVRRGDPTAKERLQRHIKGSTKHPFVPRLSTRAVKITAV